MRQRWSTVVVLAVAFVVPGLVSASAHATDVRCGALRRTPVYGIEGEKVRCPAAREVAAAHERSAARRGACRLRTSFCRVRNYACTARTGLAKRPKDVVVMCTQRERKVIFSYRGSQITETPRTPGEPAPPQEPPAEAPAS
jgi:hypothetical protein